MSLELLQVAEAVAREKDINKNEVVGAMEQAIQMAAKRKFGLHLNISATIDRLTIPHPSTPWSSTVFASSGCKPALIILATR